MKKSLYKHFHQRTILVWLVMWYCVAAAGKLLVIRLFTKITLSSTQNSSNFKSSSVPLPKHAYAHICVCIKLDILTSTYYIYFMRDLGNFLKLTISGQHNLAMKPTNLVNMKAEVFY